MADAILNPFVLTPGYTEALEALSRLKRPDLAPLFRVWQDLIVEDNRVGVLAGLDKDGVPMAAVTYRGSKAMAATFRTGKAMGTRKGRFKGMAPGRMTTKFRQVLPNNNLTAAEYRLYDGPPLAPRGEASRVIANLVKVTPRREGGAWVVACGWADVLDAKGRPFLMKHFEGKGKLKRRDLRGVRPQGQELAVEALTRFVLDLAGRG